MQTRQRGFTLAEVLVAVAVVGIIAAYGLPNLASFLRKVKENSITGAVESSLRAGRNEAIKANRGVLVCAANTTASACANSTNWGANGWLVCYDLDADNACDASTSALPNPIRIEGKVDSTFASVTGPAAPIRFLPTGNLVAGSATQTISVTGTWAGATALNVTVAATGLVKGARL